MLSGLSNSAINNDAGSDQDEVLEWMAEVPGGLSAAQEIAMHHGLHLLQPVSIGWNGM